MKVQSNQSHIDLAIIGYGNQAAFFELAALNTEYTPTVSEPYITVEIPIDFEIGVELITNNSSELFNVDQKKTIDKTIFKCATKDA